jgi:tetratricopeptide (TPR) repeat protein
MWFPGRCGGVFSCRALRHFSSYLISVFFLTAGLNRIGAQEHSGSLLPHTPAFFSLNRGNSLILTFDARGHEAEILIETSAPGLEFAIVSPGGQQLSEARAELPQWLTLSFPCAEPGQYRLVARMRSVADDVDGASFRLELQTFSAAGVKGLQEAEAVFATARSLAGSPQEAPVRASIARFRQAGKAWAAVGDREGELLALAGEAQAWLQLSDYPAALAALKRARVLSAQMPFFRAWVANLHAQLYLDREDSKSAGRYVEEAMRQSRALSDEWLTADSLADRAESEYWTVASAEHADIQEAIRLSTHAHATETLARALRCSAWIEQDERKMTHALGLLQRAEILFQRAGDSRNAAIGMSDMANNQQFSGDPYVALVRQSSLIPLIQESGKLTYLEYLLTDIADDYGALNKIPDAIAYTEQALQIAGKIEGTSREPGVSYELSQLCEFQMRTGRLHEALGNCQKSIVLFEPFHHPKWTATAFLRLGDVQHALGQKEQAIASFRRASNLSGSVHNAGLQARALMDWGGVLEDLGRRDEARSLFDAALPLSQSAPDPEVQIEARYRIAQLEFEEGRNDDAKRDLGIALDSIQAQRRAVRNADLRAAYFARVHQCHELLVEVLMREQGRDPSATASAAQALEINESGRALMLLDALATRDADAPEKKRGTALLQASFELRRTVDRAYDLRLKLMLEGGHKRELDANAAALAQAIDSLERAEDEQKTAAADSAAPSGRTLSAAEIVEASRNLDSTLVEYALGKEHSYVWVIDGGEIDSYVLPARRIIERAVRKWRDLATARISWAGESFEDHRKRVEAADRDLPHVAADLSCMLLAPFLSAHMKHLTIVLDGELDLLPFTALPESGCQGGGQPMIAEHQVTLTPSLSILLEQHETRERTSFRGEVALLADPVFDRADPRVHAIDSASGGNSIPPFEPALPRLIGTREEAKAIAALTGPGRAALYLDFNANLQTLFSPSMGAYRILHIASHGVLDDRSPDFSGIVLSLVDQYGQPVFGYLKIHDIASLNLRSDLVVLSSCDSSAGVNLSGEGVIGLSHAFLSAGAKRVVSTLWGVDDEGSKDLMIAFYSGMLRDGLDPPEALRRAQLQIVHSLHSGAPYYWAAFTMTSTVY